MCYKDEVQRRNTEKLNKKLFEGSSADLLDKIAKNPDRYIGIFRPTKPRTKIIQNITQSHEIKFGDALENIFEEYFEKMEEEEYPEPFDVSYFFGDTIEGEAKINVPTEERGRQFDAQYPSFEQIKKCCIMQDFGSQTSKVEEMWKRVKVA